MAQTQTVRSRTKRPSLKGNETLFDKIEIFLQNYEKGMVVLLLGCSVLMSFLLFNFRISEGNDDALYIKAGYDYAHKFLHYYYIINAPLYPMFLGAVIAIIGVKLFWLKFLSLVMNTAGLYFFFRSFRKRVPALLLWTILYLICLNSWFLYYASMTYTESFFLFLQALLLFYLFQLLDLVEANPNLALKDSFKSWLKVGILVFLLVLGRNVCIAVVPAMAFYFILRKKWLFSLYSIGCYVVYQVPFLIIKSILWGGYATNQFSQFGMLSLKDPYNSALGKESFPSGFINRFFGNAGEYITRRFFQVLGFQSETQTESIPILGFIVFLLFLVGFAYALRTRNNYLLYASIHVAALAGITFFVLQTRWDQPRLIMVHIPLIMLTILYGYYFTVKKSGLGRITLLVFCGLLIYSSLIPTLGKAKKNITVMRKNINGDMYYGYTPDWQNFLKMSAWCGQNLPDSSIIISRKAPMSFVYSGREFFSQYSVLFPDHVTGYSNPDSVLSFFRKQHINYIILASLRAGPEADGNIINTLHRILIPFAKKYPERVRLIHQIPESNEIKDEPCYLYEVYTK